ncbi:MAG: ATP-binding cassette domain-containing protein [Corynebacterium sp.]|nr:ATP-binding cassette domain-containing protein [Corynebacterium sp.]
MTTTVLHATGLAAKIGDRTVFENVHMRCDVGATIAITGASGSGKTTLLSCLGLLQPISDGNLTLAGRSVSRINLQQRQRIYRDYVGFIFQDFALVEQWSAYRNVEIALLPQKIRSNELQSRILSALEFVGLHDRAKETVAVLSGGEKQRVAIARLIAKRPAIVLADEPTGSLDALSRDAVLSGFAALAQQGSSLVIVTHDPFVASKAQYHANLVRSQQNNSDYAPAQLRWIT